MTPVVGNVEVVSPQDSWKNSGIPLVLLRKRRKLLSPFRDGFFGTPTPQCPAEMGFKQREDWLENVSGGVWRFLILFL